MLTRENKNIDGAARVLVAMANRTGWDMNEWDRLRCRDSFPFVEVL